MTIFDYYLLVTPNFVLVNRDDRDESDDGADDEDDEMADIKA